jgi:uncharacterized protein (TIGR02217 family)
MPWTSARQGGSPRFFSRINLDAAGHSQSFQPRLGDVDGIPYKGMPLFSGDTGSFVLCSEEFEYFKAFFNARRGKFRTFLHKNWMDYKTTHEPLINCIDPESSSEGVTYPAMGDGILDTFAFLKKYSSLKGGAHYRRILKPVPSTLKLFVDGMLVPTTAYELLPIGRVVFNPPLVGLITFDCEYDLIVRFDSDSYAVEVLNAKPGEEEFKINSIPIVEVNVNPL